MREPITRERLVTITQQVEYCLKNFPHTRNSDIDLYASWAEHFCAPFERPLFNWRDLAHAMHQVTSLDYIGRARRKVIEIHKYQKYLPTSKAIAMHRGYNEEIWRDYAKLHSIVEPSGGSNIPQGFNDEGKLTGQINE